MWEVQSERFTHTDETLEVLEDALNQFHQNKYIFIDLGIHDNFNIPKLHFAMHYARLIKLYGMMDNFNTEYMEWLHIDLTKDAYAATNFKDKFTQMTLWLKWKEKIQCHDQYVKWRLSGSPPIKLCEWIPPGLELDQKLSMAKHPSAHAVPLDHLERDYGAKFFQVALWCFIACSNEPHLNKRQLEEKIWHIHLPFRKLPVWHKIKYTHQDPFTHITITTDSIHIWCATNDKHGHPVPGRFDTALVNDGTGHETGIQGESCFFFVMHFINKL